MKLLFKIFLSLILIFPKLYSWSWIYKTNPIHCTSCVIKDGQWIWEKTSVEPFNQLILSWNAYRPKEGSYTFSVQVRDKNTRKWYNWHKVAQWGKGVQKSFTSKSSFGTQFLHVRLEIPQNRRADGFRIAVKLAQKANLTDLKNLSVNIIDMKKFVSEVGNIPIGKLPSVFIPYVPKKSQIQIDHPRKYALCSPTSTSMLLGFLLDKHIDPADIMKGVYDSGLNVYGSWPFNTAHAFETAKGRYIFHIERLPSFKILHSYLQKSIPVVVSIRANKGGAMPYRKGHLLVVVGYDKKRKKVICHDPAFASTDKTKVYYDLSWFLKSWENSRRLAYIATPTRTFF